MPWPLSSTQPEPMTEEKWTWQYDRVIPSDTSAGRRVLEEVLNKLRAEQWLQHDIFGVHLAMHEALVNAIMHGNRLDPNKRIFVRCQLSREMVRIEIADEGEGFDPQCVPDPTDANHLELPTGRGVMLMKAFMTRVDFCDRGKRVVLEKRRAPPPVDY